MGTDSLVDKWGKTLENKFGMSQAAWLPFGESIQLGDFGEFDGRQWRRKLTAADYGFDMRAWATRSTRSGQLQLISDSELVIGGGAGGGTPTGDAVVKATVHFHSASSFYLAAPEYVRLEIESPEPFGEQVYDAIRHAHGTPSLMTYLVYGITFVSEGYFVASTESGTSMELMGSVQSIETGKVDASFKMTRTSESQLATSYPAPDGGGSYATLAFKVLSWSPNGNRVQLDANT